MTISMRTLFPSRFLFFPHRQDHMIRNLAHTRNDPIEATITHRPIKVVRGFPKSPPFTHWPALPVYFDQTTYKRMRSIATNQTVRV